jgi:hypothetical protein
MIHHLEPWTRVDTELRWLGSGLRMLPDQARIELIISKLNTHTISLSLSLFSIPPPSLPYILSHLFLSLISFTLFIIPLYFSSLSPSFSISFLPSPSLVLISIFFFFSLSLLLCVCLFSSLPLSTPLFLQQTYAFLFLSLYQYLSLSLPHISKHFLICFKLNELAY